MKVSIFVEGYTELAFVREMLLRHYNYTNINIICQEIRSGDYCGVNFDYPNSEDFYIEGNGCDKFLILDCGGDQISSLIIKREKFFVENNFDRIVGLRDVYSEEFKKNYSTNFDRQKVAEFIEFSIRVIKTDTNSDRVYLNMAIMEIESWYLGMDWIFIKKNRLLTSLRIRKLCQNSDPEEIFKPSSVLRQVFQWVNEEYKKRSSQADSLATYAGREDYKLLYDSEYCDSFNQFCDNLGLDQN